MAYLTSYQANGLPWCFSAFMSFISVFSLFCCNYNTHQNRILFEQKSTLEKSILTSYKYMQLACLGACLIYLDSLLQFCLIMFIQTRNQQCADSLSFWTFHSDFITAFRNQMTLILSLPGKGHQQQCLQNKHFTLKFHQKKHE